VGIIFLTIALGIDPTSAAQTLSTVANKPSLMPILAKSVCEKHPANDAIEALRLVCARGSSDRRLPEIIPAKTIVIGFVGGFVKADDLRHPEVLFASYLRERYPNEINVKVFSNHDEKAALAYIMGHLDRDHDGIVSSEERKQQESLFMAIAGALHKRRCWLKDYSSLEYQCCLRFNSTSFPNFIKNPPSSLQM